MLPVVRDIEAVDDLNDAMVALGYVPKGENGIPGRRYFSRDVDGVRRFHVHVFEAGNPEIDRHVTFVEYLKAHPAAARQYEHVKLELSRRYPTDIVRYTDGKSQVIRELDRQAARWKPGPASVAGRP